MLRERLDFDRLRGADALPLFVCATSLTTNRMRVFTKDDPSLDALLASACRPQLHRAVEIDGEDYWDGGFTGNPVPKPLLHLGTAQDLVLVHLNPTRRAALPISARDFLDRLNEVTMNAAPMRELEGIDLINRLIEAGQLQHPRGVVIGLHGIAEPAVMAGLGMGSKSNAAWPCLTYLRAAGRAAAAWLGRHRAALGRASTLDLAEFAL